MSKHQQKDDLIHEIANCIEARSPYWSYDVYEMGTNPVTMRLDTQRAAANGYGFGGVRFQVRDIGPNTFTLRMWVRHKGRSSTLDAEFGGPDHAASRLFGMIEALHLAADTIGQLLHEHKSIEDPIDPETVTGDPEPSLFAALDD